MKRLMIVPLVIAAFVLMSCSTNSEQDNLAEAQKCLDNVPESDPSQAEACMAPIQNYSDPQADTLKCSITITYGGLTEDRLVDAYNLSADSTQTNQAASFMAALSLDDAQTTGYTLAQQANQYCLGSGQMGLIYISDLILTGTYMNMVIENLDGGTGVNVNDPSSLNSAVTSLVSTCAGASPPASCTQDLATLGSTVTNLSSSYCGTAGADQNVCGQVTGAVNSAGGNSSAVGQALFCYLNKQTYNATTNACQ